MQKKFSKEKNDNLFKKLQNVKGKDLSEYRIIKNMIAELNQGLVFDYAKEHFLNTNLSLNDKIESCQFALNKAIDTFDLNQNISFFTYASRCMENEIKMYLRKNIKHQSISSMDEVIHQKDGSVINKYELIPSSVNLEKAYIENEQLHELYIIINSLEYKQKEVVRRLYGIGCEMQSLKEVASSLNLSQSYMSRILKKALFEIKKLFIMSEKLNISVEDLCENNHDKNILKKEKNENSLLKVMSKNQISFYKRFFKNRFNIKSKNIDYKMMIILNNAFNLLTNKQQEIFKLYYGFENEKLSLNEIAKKFNVSIHNIRYRLEEIQDELEIYYKSLSETGKIKKSVLDSKTINIKSNANINVKDLMIIYDIYISEYTNKSSYSISPEELVKLHYVLNSLDEKVREVVILSSGLNGAPLKPGDISKMFGYTKFQISELINESRYQVLKRFNDIKNDNIIYENVNYINPYLGINIDNEKERLFKIFQSVIYDLDYDKTHTFNNKFWLQLYILFDSLEDLEKKIFKLYYGIDGEERSLNQISRILNLYMPYITRRIDLVTIKLRKNYNQIFENYNQDENFNLNKSIKQEKIKIR